MFRDVENKVAKQYGLVYKLPDTLSEVYKNGIGLQNHNSDDSNELPITTTYIIVTKGIVQYAFLDADFRKRARISGTIEVLKMI